MSASTTHVCPTFRHPSTALSASLQPLKYQVLVIDDIGYVKKTDAETQVLFEFIDLQIKSLNEQIDELGSTISTELEVNAEKFAAELSKLNQPIKISRA